MGRVRPRHGHPAVVPGQTRCTVSTIHDGDTPRTFADEAEAVTSDGHVEIRLEPYGGFVAALTPAK